MLRGRRIFIILLSSFPLEKVGKEQREKLGSLDLALQSTVASCGTFHEFEAQRFWADTQPHSDSFVHVPGGALSLPNIEIIQNIL